jgi:GAF domain-containing protein
MGRGAKPKKDKVQGKLPGAHTSRKNDGAKVRDLEKRLAESLKREAEALMELQTRSHEVAEAHEQLRATSEILRVISSSTADLQPVLDTVTTSAARLCEASDASIYSREGERLVLVANHGAVDIGPIGEFYLSLSPDTVAGRAVLEGRTIHVTDLQAEGTDFLESRDYARRMGHRTILSVPLMREGVAIGAIALRRTEAQLFTERQVTLLEAFTAKAVIAIANARLFNETKEALERQTATAEILRVISSSPTDVAPVFATIIRSAVQLSGARRGALLRFDGELVHLVAHHNQPAEALASLERAYPMRPSRVQVSGRAILSRAVAEIHDVRNDPEYLPGMAAEWELGSVLGVPMLRADGTPTGVITIQRSESGPFAAGHVELLKTFADQAVIAIENVRLFTELQASNRELTEALEQQTATSEILRTISASLTDVQPVFDAIAQSARRLCDGNYCTVARYDGELVHITAHAYIRLEGVEAMQRFSTRPPSRALALGRTILDGAVVHIPDALADPEYDQSVAQAVRFRSIIGVPMLRDGGVIGAITVSRTEVRPFTDTQIALLKTFADQAVIAIENVRLFSELQTRNRQLTEALEQQTATAEILRVISSSPTSTQPVFDAILDSATRLCAADHGILYHYDSEVFQTIACHGLTPDQETTFRSESIPPGPYSGLGRLLAGKRPVQVADLTDDIAYRQGDLRRVRFVTLLGARSAMWVPLLQNDVVVGAMAIYRRKMHPFTDNQIELVTTFADQAVIAIENVRLFTELQTRTGELTRSVGELRALGEVGQAISSTLDLQTVLQTIVARATELAGVDAGVIYEYNQHGEIFVPRATEHLEAEIVETLIAAPVRRGEGVTGRLADSHEPIQLSDILQAPPESRVRDTLGRAGYRALLAVPLVREDHLLGGLTVFRKAPGEFSPEVIELLRTFATQSALAIQNARLFREIEAKSRELEVASQHKSEFLANMSHELRTPLNAIIGFSEVLGERMFGELNEKQEEYLKDIHASGQHLLSLINDILDLSKIEAGRMELELTDFDLPTAIDNALTLVRERAGRRGIALHQAADERLGQIRGDERKIKQVLLNLLSNAIKFTPDGGRIDVRAAAVDGSVEVSVTDTGVGIAPEDQEAIFEEFRQVGTADKKVEGTGLGLALSRKFIELHGGRIWVTSQVGVGSTFTFTLPVRHGE